MTFSFLVADFVGLDPRIAAWLIDPSDTAPSFGELVAKHLEKSITVKASSTYGNSSRSCMVSHFKVWLIHLNSTLTFSYKLSYFIAKKPSFSLIACKYFDLGISDGGW